jgi:hypothetical protein
VGRFIPATAATLILCAVLCAAFSSPARAQPVMWRTVRSNRIVINHSRTMPDNEVQGLIRMCEKARETVEDWFGAELRQRMEIRLYPDTPSYVSTTGASWWYAAVWQGDILHMQPPHMLAERGVLYTTLVHEYTHMALDSFVKLDIPDWFQEGLSAHISGEFTDSVQGKEKDFVWRGTLDELSAALLEADKPARAENAYHGAFILIHELDSKFSKKAILEFLNDLEHDSLFNVTFEIHFKQTPHNYLKSIQKKYPRNKKN